MANEKRLIDANALLAYINNHDYELVSRMGCVDKGMFTDGIKHGIDIQPTVDAVEVVHGRCKDCKHYVAPQGTYVCACFEGMNFSTDNDFCSYGERREGE